MKKETKEPITILLDKEYFCELNNLVEILGTPRSEIVRRMVQNALDCEKNLIDKVIRKK